MNVTIVAEQLRRRVPGGVGTYASGLLLGLDRAGVGDRGDPAITVHASRAPSDPDPLIDYGFPVRSSAVPGRGLTRLWDWGLVHSPRGADVVHAVSLATPPPRARESLAAMVHDLAWREVPETFPSRGRRWHEAALRRCLRRAAAVVVPSERTAASLGSVTVPVEVIPHGCDHLPGPDGAGAAALLDRLGVTKPYLLSVSTLEPRKNLARLVAAYQRASASLPENWPLVVVGPPGWGPSLAPAPGVVLAGPVGGAVLAALYRDARCVAYVPLLEGFGLPAVEAMAQGAPVVASPMPSTAGAALEVEPTDVDAIAAALIEASVDGSVRSTLVGEGARRAASLTWAASAEQHVRLWASL